LQVFRRGPVNVDVIQLNAKERTLVSVDYSVLVIDWKNYIAHAAEFPEDDLGREAYLLESEELYLTDSDHGLGLACLDWHRSVAENLPPRLCQTLETFFGSVMPDYFEPSFLTVHKDWPLSDDGVMSAIHPTAVDKLFNTWKELDHNQLLDQLKMIDEWPYWSFASADEFFGYIRSWARFVEFAATNKAGIIVSVG
jgi:hypothetical protein